MKDLLWPLHVAVNPSSYKREIFPEMGEMTVKILARINNSLELVCKKLAGWILILFTLTISVQVTLRAVFSYPLSWAQDGAVMLFIWMVFLGAPVALRQRSHFIIDLFNGRVGRSSLFCDVISDILIFVFLYVLIVYGSTFVKITSSMYYSYIYVPQAVAVISIPVSAAIMTLMNIENLVKDLRTLASIGAACEGGVRNG